MCVFILCLREMGVSGRRVREEREREEDIQVCRDYLASMCDSIEVCVCVCVWL